MARRTVARPAAPAVTTQEPEKMDETQVVETNVDENAAATSDGQDRPNANAAQIAVDEFRERTHKDANTLRRTLKDISDIVAGDVKGAAYTKAKAGLGAMQVRLPEMITWWPNSKAGGDFNAAVTQLHNELDPENSPAAFELISRVLITTLAASDPAIAIKARMGDSRDPKKPQYKAVVLRVLEDANLPVDQRSPDSFAGTQADAKRTLQSEIAKATAAGDKDLAAVWQQGFDAIDNVELIRRLASDKAAMGMRKTRWRRTLYVGVCQEHLDAYATRVPAPLVSIGKVWDDALGVAAAAHAKYMSDAKKLHGGAVSVDGLKAAIDTAVTKFLDDKAGPTGRKIKDEKDEIKAIVAGMWKYLDLVDKEFTTALAETVDFEIRKLAKTRDLDEVEQIMRPSQARQQQKERAERDAEEKAREALEQAGEADKAEADAAKAARQQQRTAQREQAAAKDATPPAANAPTPRRSRSAQIARPA